MESQSEDSEAQKLRILRAMEISPLDIVVSNPAMRFVICLFKAFISFCVSLFFAVSNSFILCKYF